MVTGYLHWTLVNTYVCEHLDEIQALVNKMSLTQKLKYAYDYSLSENVTDVDFPFACSVNHPKIAKEIKVFYPLDDSVFSDSSRIRSHYN